MRVSQLTLHHYLPPHRCTAPRSFAALRSLHDDPPHRLNLSRLPLVDVPDALVRVGPRGVEHALPVRPLVRVPPEEVALRLGQVGREALAPVRVEVVERPGQRRGRDAVPHGDDDHPAPGGRALVELPGDDGVEDQVREVVVPGERVLDLLEEGGADDAPPLPHARALAEVDVPAHVVAGALDDAEALGVGAHLGGVQRGLEVVEICAL